MFSFETKFPLKLFYEESTFQNIFLTLDLLLWEDGILLLFIWSKDILKDIRKAFR